MPYQKKSLKEINEDMLADASISLNVSRFAAKSIVRALVKAVSAGVYLLLDYLGYIKDQSFATSAEGANLGIIGLEYGVPQKDAAKAGGKGSTVGTNGIIIPEKTRLSFQNFLYETDYQIVISGGSATLEFTALQVGIEGNQEGGVTLNFVSPIPGIESTVLVDIDGITNGTNIETDDSYRARILSVKRLPPHGGIETDYQRWVLEIPGNTRAWTFPQYQGAGTMGVSFVRDLDDPIIPTSEQEQYARDYIIYHLDPVTGIPVGAPAGAEPGIFMVTLQFLTQNMTIQIFPNTETVRNSVIQQMYQLFFQRGGPGSDLALSQISEAISAATNENKNRLIFPVVDIGIPINRILQLGVITFEDYA